MSELLYLPVVGDFLCLEDIFTSPVEGADYYFVLPIELWEEAKNDLEELLRYFSRKFFAKSEQEQRQYLGVVSRLFSNSPSVYREEKAKKGFGIKFPSPPKIEHHLL